MHIFSLPFYITFVKYEIFYLIHKLKLFLSISVACKLSHVCAQQNIWNIKIVSILGYGLGIFREKYAMKSLNPVY